MTVSREETQRKIDLQAEAGTAHTPQQAYTVADRYEEHAALHPDKVFLLCGSRRVSFAELNREANRVAAAAMDMGLATGDVAALMMENRPEFFFIYVGLAKLGITVALLNTNVREQALRHAITSTASKVLFIGSECLAQLESTPGIEDGLRVVVCVDADEPAQGMELLDVLLNDPGTNNPPRSVRVSLRAEHDLFYIFTSGTTGLPKAARYSHMRWLNIGESNRVVMSVTPDDVFYCYLPLYHGAAGTSLASAALSRGASIVLRRRFSASQFWPDVNHNGVTICQYIGEVCRYLLNQPATDRDADNTVRTIIGAGLNAATWTEFQQRFAVEQVVEGWGATEANCGMFNLDDKVGSCGRIPYRDKSIIRLVRYDIDNDCHLKDREGRLIECDVDQVGEVISMILDIPGSAAGRFEGYTDAEATEKKILRDVFSAGDAWFSSGDLMRRDNEDYYYFVDRIGDTFRWKSENVSTMEVAEALAGYPGLEIINVYGVRVPGHEGRAGMASLVMQDGAGFDPETFYTLCNRQLPRYAVPLFLRISQHVDMTATFKLRKLDLKKDGYSAHRVAEPLFVCDETAGRYVGLTDEALRRLEIPAFESD